MNRTVPWVLLLCWFVAPAARADEKWPVPREPSREPVPYRYDRQAWKKVPRSFLENSPACLLYSATSHVIGEGGMVETTSHEIARLNGRKGIDSLGEYRSIYFTPHYQKLTLNEARIHKPDGRIVEIEPRHVQLRDVATDYLIYDLDKQLVISFPNLEVGDVYEVKWTVRGKSPEFGGQFFTRYSFGDDRHPVVRDELHVVLPKSKTFKHASVNGKIDLSVEERGQNRHYRWAVNNRGELPRDEDRPSVEEQRWQVACSTFASWEEVAKWKQKVRAECWACTPAVKKVIADVAGPHKTQLDKARALTYWVRRQIRYVSRGPSGLGYTPHPPERVLSNLYGDCKDQAQLLAVMFKEIGLPVYLATLGTLDDGQVLKEVPSPWGTHAILLVKIDGKDHWIDTTVAQAAWDYLPRSDRDRLAYLTRDAELLLLRTPAFTSEDQRYEQTSEIFVQSDGSSRTLRRSTYHGAAALSRRDAWLETPVGERRRLVTQDLQDANTRSRLVSLQIDDRELLDFDRPVTASVEFRIPRHFSGEDSLEGSLTDSVVWNRILAYNLDPERKVALQLPGPFTSTHRYRIQLPAAYRFDGLPTAQTVRSRWGQLSLEVKPDPRNPRRLELVLQTRLEKDRVQPEHFSEFQKFHEDITRAYRVWLTLKPTRSLADVPLLETLLVLAPGADRVAAGALARIYLDSDKLDDARRVLDTTLLYRPKDRALWDLKVKTAATHAEEEKIYRTLVATFPKEVRYQLALGTTLVKRHNHAGARQVLEPITTTGPDGMRGKAQYQLARSAFHEQNYQASLKHLEAARGADPSLLEPADALHFLARNRQKLGDNAGAEQAYRKAWEADPQSSEVLAELIQLKLPRGDSKETLDLVRRFTLLAGKEPATLVQAAEFHYRLGRLEDAFELASRARDKGFHARAQRLLGLVHLRQGGLEQAIFHLDRADADAEVLEALVRAHLGLGQLHLAELRLAQPVEKSSPGLAELTPKVKELAQKRQEYLRKLPLPSDRKAACQRALDSFLCAEEALRQGEEPGRVGKLLAGAFAEEGVTLSPALALRALLSLQEGKISLAVADADRALALGPADSRAHLVRGRARLLRGDKAALADLEQAAQLSQNQDGVVLHWLAAAQFQAGQRDKALVSQRQAVALRPQDEEARAQLKEFERR